LAVTLEDLVLAHRDHHVQVARWPAIDARLAFARQADTVAGINTRRHLDRQGLVFFHPTLTVAIPAGITDHLAGAVATGTGLLHRENALLHAHLAMTATGSTGNRAGALLGAATIAGLAAHQGGHPDGNRGATHGLFQVKLQGIPQITAALHAGTAATTAAAKDIAEDITEDIGEVAATKAAGPSAHVRVDPGVAVLVVGGSLVGVGEHFVGLVGLLEFLFGILVIRIAVRVIFHCQPAIGLFQLGFTGAALHAQHFIIVTLGHISCFL